MPKDTDNLKEILKYIDLDLDELPQCLSEFEQVNFNTERLNNDKELRIFKYIPIDEIEIFFTPSHRDDDIKKKYSNAEPIAEYLKRDDTDDSARKYATFLEMLKSVKKEDIDNIAELQKKYEKGVPLKIAYDKCHLWQIYYSLNTKKYFMMVPTQEESFAELFYLIKKKIEFEKNKRNKSFIYVPINYVHYTEEYLNRAEISDIENYLWIFTKNWTHVYEVFDKNGDMRLYITGETSVYDKAKSEYVVRLNSKEDAIKFSKLAKALFIMETETNNKYKFLTKIDNQNNLEFWIDNRKLEFEDLADFISDEYVSAEKSIKDEKEKSERLNTKLEILKVEVKEKESVYIEKQKEISTYLEYRKTFFGKFKYFFKSGKVKKIKKAKGEENAEIVETSKEDREPKPMQIFSDDKKFHTIEDLITIQSLLEKSIKYSKNIEQDIKAMELKLENLKRKIDNAKLYIDEIDKHKKSIFDFWKFANKDELKSLEEGSIINSETKNIHVTKKIFDPETDLEELGTLVDNIQRKKLSKEEADSVFVAKSNILYIINLIKSGNFDKDALSRAVDNLKDEFDNNKVLISSEAFDIFGNMHNDNTKIKYIGSKSHRESEKNKFRILNINKKIDVIDFTEKVQEIVNYLNEVLNKIKSVYDMQLYKLLPINEHLRDKSFDVYNFNLEKELEECTNYEENAYNLIKINIKEGMPLAYFSNIILYDNYNKTLPVGMDLSSNVLLDCSKFDYELINKTRFKTNKYSILDDINPKPTDIFVYEYNVKMK